MAAGFVLLYGPWGWVLWREFGNPFFPYFNSVFQSPWWEPTDFFDRNFGPRNWRQWVFFPIYLARDYRLVGEVSFRDYRLATLFVLALAAWATSRWRNLRENPNAPPPPVTPEARAWRILAVFAIVSYFAWLKTFAIYRYLVVLEAISGALIVGCILYLTGRGRLRLALVLALAALLVGTTRHGSWGRIAFGTRYFDVAVPKVEANALVVLGYSHPLAYAAPFFPPDARFVSPANNFIHPGQRNRLARKADELIRGHAGPRYYLQYRELGPMDLRVLEQLGLALDTPRCQPVPSSLDDNHMQLCPLVRAGR
jgi:hypothetical protein